MKVTRIEGYLIENNSPVVDGDVKTHSEIIAVFPKGKSSVHSLQKI